MVFNENENDSSKNNFDDIADIFPLKESVSIKVRVLRMWKVPAFLNPSIPSSIEMVLIDQKGGKIHASIRKQLIHLGSYRTTLHPHKLLFQLKTTVKLSDDSSDINKYGFNFTEIAEICANSHDHEFLVDVIGYMSGMSAEKEYIRDGKITKMLIFELTDHSGKCEVALFGDYVHDLKKKMLKSSGCLPIVVVQFAKIKTFRDKVSLQNVINTTRLFINPDIPDVESFKNSVAVHGIESDIPVPLIGEPEKPSAEDEFLILHPKRTVAELINNNEEDSGSYFCDGCGKHVFQVVPRFRVKFEVTDGKACAVFVIFDSEMSYIMEKSCAYFVAQSKATNAGPHPIEFESLFGKKFLFVVDSSSKNPLLTDLSYKVKRISFDPKIIDRFCAQGPFLIPSKPMSPPINVDTDSASGSSDDVAEDSEPVEFLKDLIITPPAALEDSVVKDEAVGRVKRTLSKTYDSAGKRQFNKRTRKLKIDED
ncbi:replication factor A protein [Trifolium repens]|nr:replication factor A protein [Trifolium repens]